VQKRPVLIIGGTGLLGEALRRELESLGELFVAPRKEELDLREVDRLHDRLKGIAPHAVVNAAAFTDVAQAESPRQREQVIQLNRDGPAGLAAACTRLGVPLIHVSTDYVFDGRKREPYRESDPVNPLQAYGRSKLEGERAVSAAFGDAVVARTSTLYGPGRRKRPHYVDAVLRQAHERDTLRVVRAPVSSPTYAPDLARALLRLLECRASGLVHVVNAGGCSRLELAREAIRLAGLEKRVEVRERAEPPGSLDRPAYSVLDSSRYTALTGSAVRSWADALREYLGAG
jgi:dTDP-4-dehydrorhamnose reductase